MSNTGPDLNQGRIFLKSVEPLSITKAATVEEEWKQPLK